MKTCIDAMEDAYRELNELQSRLPAAHRLLRAAGAALLSLGHHGGRVAQARRLRDSHEVRHARLGKSGRLHGRGQVLHGARHLLRPDFSDQHAQRRAAGDHERRLPAAYARRRLRRPRHQISGAQGCQSHGDDRLRRHGAHLRRSDQAGPAHRSHARVQPDEKEPRSLRRRDDREARHRSDRRRLAGKSAQGRRRSCR